MILTAIIPLSIICYQDLKSREISWYWPIVLFLILGIAGFLASSATSLNILFNITILSVLLSFLSIYFSIKERKLTWIFDHYLGWGDVVFLLAVVPFFEMREYVLFIILSSIFSIVVFKLSDWILKGNDKTVPLAGLQSVYLTIVILIQTFDFANW